MVHLKSPTIIFFSLFILFDMYAQELVYHQSFEDEGTHLYKSTSGIKGQSLDLTKDASIRKGLTEEYLLHNQEIDFSVLLWVNSAQQDWESYEILSAVMETGSDDKPLLKKPFFMNTSRRLSVGSDVYEGWSIGVQENGAWYWDIREGEAHFTYSPTPQRQSIRDGEWHLLAFTYNAAKKEVWLYYDGINVAIYSLEGINQVNKANKLNIGGMVAGDLGSIHTFNGKLDEIKIYDQQLHSAYILEQYQKHFPKKREVTFQANPTDLKVMLFNIWIGGRQMGKTVGLERTIDLIEKADADVVCLIETYGSGAKIADALGYYFYLRCAEAQGEINTYRANLSILSRYPITETVNVFKPFHSGGSRIKVSDNQQIVVMNSWLNTLPRKTALLLSERIEEDKLPELIRENSAVRIGELSAILEGIQAFTDNADQEPVIFAGDLNSGSHLDWTAENRERHNGNIVAWPESKLLFGAGYRDTFRLIHPDPVSIPGISHIHIPMRIDYIYWKGKGLMPENSYIIEKQDDFFPSDHAAVVTEFKWNTHK